MATNRLTWQHFDVVFKLEARPLVAALPRHLGLHLPPVVEQLATDLPRVDVHIEYMDALFRLEDGSVIHLEFQTTRRRQDLARFLLYDAQLAVKYPATTIHTIVIFGAGIEDAADELLCGTIHYKVRNVFLGKQDGAAVHARLRQQADSGIGFSADDRLDLVFLPLMKHQLPMTEVLSEAVTLVRQLPEPEQRQTFAGMLSMGFRFLTEDDLERLVEKLMTTPTGLRLLEQLAQQAEQRYQQGLEQGLEQGLVRGKREDILLFLTARFTTVPDTLRERLESVTSLEHLNDLVHLALTATSLEEFAAALPQS